MLRILGLVVVLLIALVGYRMGMDAGGITVLIAVLAVAMFILSYLQKKHGAKKMLGGVVNGLLSVYDPTFPHLSSGPDTFHGPFSENAGYEYPTGLQTNLYSSNERTATAPQRASMAQQGREAHTSKRLQGQISRECFLQPLVGW